MAVSRRKFLKAGTLVILSAGVPLKVVAAKSLDPTGSKILKGSHLEATRLLNQATFTAHLNTKFKVAEGENQVVNIELIQVQDLRTAKIKGSAAMTGRECFSTVFVGPRQRPLRQNTYAVEHQALGNFSVLLVPLGRGREGRFYEAIFNRLY
jgi:hypothetical protein